ncbi:MAG TPA: radical SAM protein [Candidatus Obscuribacterales bacterium]
MLEKEIFLIPKRPKAKPCFGVSWFFPSPYNIGMSGLGYQLVWSLLERDEDIEAKRGFTDCHETGAENSELFGFTVSWELDFVNILSLLKKFGIAELACERADEAPIVFGGGPVLTANPEPFADFFDVVLLGDAESVVPTFIDAWKEARRLATRAERLLRLAQCAGVYVPRFYQYELESKRGPISKIAATGNDVPQRLTKQLFSPPPGYVAHSVILSPDTTWGEMFLVEVVRSCPQECRFCLASFLTRPFRPAKVNALLDAIDLGLQHTSKIGLLGPSVTEHPKFEEIAEALRKRPQAKISVASVRADSLTESVLSTLHSLGQRSVTIAIESGSERLRAIMKKNLSEPEIVRAVELIDKAGLEGVKFYGIVGLPHETTKDLDETVRLMTALKKKHKRLKFVLGLSSFVPKAQTPFQWASRDRECGDKLEYVRKKLAAKGIEVRAESHNWSDVQTLLSRGDRRLTEMLLEIASSKGNLGAWKKAMRQERANCPGADFYIWREIPEGETLPWSHLLDNSRTEYLLSHFTAASETALPHLPPHDLTTMNSAEHTAPS